MTGNYLFNEPTGWSTGKIVDSVSTERASFRITPSCLVSK